MTNHRLFWLLFANKTQTICTIDTTERVRKIRDLGEMTLKFFFFFLPKFNLSRINKLTIVLFYGTISPYFNYYETSLLLGHNYVTVNLTGGGTFGGMKAMLILHIFARNNLEPPPPPPP